MGTRHFRRHSRYSEVPSDDTTGRVRMGTRGDLRVRDHDRGTPLGDCSNLSRKARDAFARIDDLCSGWPLQAEALRPRTPLLAAAAASRGATLWPLLLASLEGAPSGGRGESAPMAARAGLLHVTVITATLLRDSAGSDIEPADTYASVGCGNQNFTTNSVKNYRAKPSWNESHTFRFEGKNELDSQHILIEIFAEKPRLDELLGLAKIPLHTVINVGDEISTHSLNRPDEEYSGRGHYSGHVKVALRWDCAQSRAPAYPQAYSPAARYDPQATASATATSNGFYGRSQPQMSQHPAADRTPLHTSKSQGAEDVRHHLGDSDDYAAAAGLRSPSHYRSSSYPSRSYSFRSPAPPSPSPSQSPSPWGQLANVAAEGPPMAAAAGTPSRAFPSSSAVPPRHSFDARSKITTPDHEYGAPSSALYTGPHVPYVSQEGNNVRSDPLCHQGQYVHCADSAQATNSNSNLHRDNAQSTPKMLSKSKQAEMAKLAELSRLTETAKIQATGFAKAGHGNHHHNHHRQQQQHQHAPTQPQGMQTVQPQQHHHLPPLQFKSSPQPPAKPQQRHNSGYVGQPIQTVPPKPKADQVFPQVQQQQQQQTRGPPEPKRDRIPLPQPLYEHPSSFPTGSQRYELPTKELAIVPTDPAQARPPEVVYTNESRLQITPHRPRPPDVLYEKAVVQKADRKAEQKLKDGAFRRTLKLLRKKSTKILGI